MKKGIRIIKIAECIIKKIFSIGAKNDIYHECETALKTSNEKNENETEEYLKNYQATTRWQTL